MTIVSKPAIVQRNYLDNHSSTTGARDLDPEVMAIDHLLGLLTQTLGRLEDAMSHFEDALAFSRQAGWRPELAWTCHDYAYALLQRASASSAQVRRSDRGKAIGLLDE